MIGSLVEIRWLAAAFRGCCRGLAGGDVDDRLGESVRRFLWQVVADAAFDEPVLIATGEFFA